ncbi:hypothetical protein BC826DRAFT_683247 [Russula brevipes]|nr:hypothetical protein BC826DRAFT_683247 [Russula brevipes]
MNGLQPDVVMRHLRESNLDIHQVPCDLSSSNESSNTSADIVHVATLSVIFHNQNPPFPVPFGLFASQDSVTTETPFSTPSNVRGWMSPPALTRLAVAELPSPFYGSSWERSCGWASLFDAPSQSITPAMAHSQPAFHSSQQTSLFAAPSQSITPAVSRSWPTFHSSQQTLEWGSLFDTSSQPTTLGMAHSQPAYHFSPPNPTVQEGFGLLDGHSLLVPSAASQSQATSLNPPTGMSSQPRLVCPKCGVHFRRKQERVRHIRSHLPFCAFCPFPGCPWRGDRKVVLNRHWRIKHSGHEEVPMPSRNEIYVYDPAPLVKLVVEGDLTVDSAAGAALLEVERRAGELGKIGVWADWWGRKT